MVSKVEPRTLKGFKDYLPEEQRLRQKIMDTCREVFELYGFLPLDTPALEYLDVLVKKYGEEEKLIYSFEDKGGRQVGMRYDLTVPMARVVAQYQNEFKLPFRNYRIGKVWRAENPQKGRYREFMQADADMVGVDSLSADAECIAMYYEIWKRLGIKNCKIVINTRKVFDELGEKVDLSAETLKTLIRVIDKTDKVGWEGVLKMLSVAGLSSEQISETEKFLEGEAGDLPEFSELKNYLSALGIPDSAYEFNTKIARGLDYYTGTVFENLVPGSDIGSIGSGGRYDGLVEEFLNKKVPAVGMSVGVDRVLALMQEQGLQLTAYDLPLTKVLVMNLGSQFAPQALALLRELRENKISAEYFYDEKDLDRQFKYAESLGIPYSILIGEEEIKNNTVTLRDLNKREQESLERSETVKKLKNLI